MHVRPMPPVYIPSPPVPSESAKATRAPQLQRQIDALQEERRQAASAGTPSPAAGTVPQGQSDLSRTLQQANGSFVDATSFVNATSSRPDDSPGGSPTGSTGGLVDVMA
jgi:hypothetical protein